MRCLTPAECGEQVLLRGALGIGPEKDLIELRLDSERGEWNVAIGIAGSVPVGTIAPRECDRGAAGAPCRAAPLRLGGSGSLVEPDLSRRATSAFEPVLLPNGRT